MNRDPRKQYGWDNWVKWLDDEARKGQVSENSLEKILEEFERGDFSAMGLDHLSPEELKQFNQDWL